MKGKSDNIKQFAPSLTQFLVHPSYVGFLVWREDLPRALNSVPNYSIGAVRARFFARPPFTGLSLLRVALMISPPTTIPGISSPVTCTAASFSVSFSIAFPSCLSIFPNISVYSPQVSHYSHPNSFKIKITATI